MGYQDKGQLCTKKAPQGTRFLMLASEVIGCYGFLTKDISNHYGQQLYRGKCWLYESCDKRTLQGQGTIRTLREKIRKARGYSSDFSIVTFGT